MICIARPGIVGFRDGSAMFTILAGIAEVCGEMDDELVVCMNTRSGESVIVPSLFMIGKLIIVGRRVIGTVGLLINGGGGGGGSGGRGGGAGGDILFAGRSSGCMTATCRGRTSA